MTDGNAMRTYEVVNADQNIIDPPDLMSAGVSAGEKHRIFRANAAEPYRFV